MATTTLSLPDPTMDWIETQVRKGEFASVESYLRDLVRRDRALRDQALTLEELQQLIADSRVSGIGERGLDELFAQAERIALSRRASA